jgi:hypothetical protein
MYKLDSLLGKPLIALTRFTNPWQYRSSIRTADGFSCHHRRSLRWRCSGLGQAFQMEHPLPGLSENTRQYPHRIDRLVGELFISLQRTNAREGQIQGL